MRVVGFDLGERRIGVAVSDDSGAMAVGHGVVQATGDPRADLVALAGVVAELQPQRLVVGLPLSLDGGRGPAARRAEAYAAALADAFGLPVELVDERLTTVTANRSLAGAGVGTRARRRVVDQVAATVLLQSWLDGRRAEPDAPSEPEREPE